MVATTPTTSGQQARLPLVLAGLGSALVAAGGVAFYWRPFKTLRAWRGLQLRLGGATERRLAINGVPLRYYEAGPADAALDRAIVLLPGLGDSAESWTGVLPALAREWRVLALELAGFGKTPAPPEGMHFSVLTDYFARFLDAAGVRRAVLVGNSLGGAVAIRYAARHPSRVERLVLLDSAGLTGRVATVLEPTTLELASELVAITVGPERRLPRFILRDLLRNVEAPARRAYLASEEPTNVTDDLPVLARLGIPTTLVWGEHDRLIPLEQGERMRDALPGAELIVLPGGGHSPQSDRPREVVRIVRERLGDSGAS